MIQRGKKIRRMPQGITILEPKQKKPLFQKNSQEMRLPILKISQVQTIFLQKHFRNLKKYSGNIRGMILKQTCVECSSKILKTLLCDYWSLPKDQYLLL